MLWTNVSLVFLKLIQNLSNDCMNCNKTTEFNVINKLINAANEQRRIDTIVYFGSDESIKNYIAPIATGIPKLIFTHNCKELKVGFATSFNSNIFFLAFGKLKGPHKWLSMYNAFADMQRHVRGIFVAPFYQNDINEHFAWCWQSGLVSVIALVKTYSNVENFEAPFELYSYTPFPYLNITKSSLQLMNNQSYFMKRLSDFRGYEVRTAMEYDPPRVFPVKIGYGKEQRTLIGGYAGRTYREFLKYHNAHMKIIPSSNLSCCGVLSVIEKLNQKEADLSMNIYFNYPGVRTSYPIRMMKWCILLPSRGEIHSYEYFLRPFQTRTWLACMLMLIFLSFIAALNEYIVTKVRLSYSVVHFPFGRTTLETLRLMFWLSTPPVYRYFRPHYAFNYILVSIFGFILSNFYLASLTSFLTNIILERQIDTIQEMIDLNISIYTVEQEIPYVLENRGLPKGFAELLVSRNVKQVVSEVLSLNITHAYLVHEDTLKFTLEQQRNDLKPKFHIVKECISTIPVGFIMPIHSPFKTVLDLFTMQVASAGLLERWFHVTILDGFHVGLLKHRKKMKKTKQPLSLAHFQFAYLMLIIGTCLASISFGLEQLAHFKLSFKIHAKVVRRLR